MNEANQITNTTTLYGFIAEEAQQNRFAVVLNKLFKTDAIAGHEAMMIPMNIRPDDFYFTLSNLKKSKVSGAVLGLEYQQEVLELLDDAEEAVKVCGVCDIVTVDAGRLKGSVVCGEALNAYFEATGANKIAVVGTGPQAKALALASNGRVLSFFDAKIESVMQLSQDLGVEVDINRCAAGMEVDLSGFDAVFVSPEVDDLSMVVALPSRSVDLKSKRQVSALRQRCAELNAAYEGYEELLDYLTRYAHDYFNSLKDKA